MKRFSNCFSICLLACAAAVPFSSHADENSLPGQAEAPEPEKEASALPEKYQAIIDSNLFGPPPSEAPLAAEKNAVSAKEAEKIEREMTKEQERLVKTVEVSAFHTTPEGVLKIGFSDSSNGKKIPYYLAVGESRDGWLVVSADDGDKKVVLKKDGIEVECVLGQKNASAPQQPNNNQGAGGASASNGQPPSHRSSLLSSRANYAPNGSVQQGGASNGDQNMMSRRARRRQAYEAERRAAQERESQRDKAAEEQRQRDKAEAEKRFQMIRDELRSIREEKNVVPESNANTREMQFRE